MPSVQLTICGSLYEVRSGLNKPANPPIEELGLPEGLLPSHSLRDAAFEVSTPDLRYKSFISADPFEFASMYI